MYLQKMVNRFRSPRGSLPCPERLPLVHDGHLRPPAEHAAPVAVGSPAWFGWLDAPTTRSFAFQGAHGTMTVRKDARQRGGAYWVGYRKTGGKLRNVYLGKSTNLTLARLEEAATGLAGPAGPRDERTATAAASETPHPERRRPTGGARRPGWPRRSGRPARSTPCCARNCACPRPRRCWCPGLGSSSGCASWPGARWA